MNELVQIFIIAIIQAIYDFAGWFIWLGEPEKYDWKAVLFRILKFIFDYPVSILLMLNAGWNVNQIIGFYVFKQLGGVDCLYYIIHFILRNGKVDETGIWWMWWTPLGWHRSQIYYNHLLPFPKVKLVKGELTRIEVWVQACIGLILGYLIVYFRIADFIINLF
jgi:hypothetical protein